jgi:hypothetical protein
MTRHIYRNQYAENELREVISTLKQLRKHQYDHFRLVALVEMEHAVECLNRALEETQLSPQHVEELNG